MITYNDIYLNARRKLIKAGIEDAGRYARMLLASATGRKLESVLRDLNLYTSDGVNQAVMSGTDRLVTGEPLEYITGSCEFSGLTIKVNSNVLIPRPDTEVLVEAAKEVLTGKKQNARILDLCTGSGCIACALASSLPAARFVAVDCSEEALDVCRSNLAANNFSGKVVCMQADALKAPPMGIGVFDMIVSNPPYIKTEEIASLDSSVKDYEPHLALDGGKDGFRFYRSIIKYWKMQLLGGGHMLFEVGEDQASDVKEMLLNAGFSSVDTRKDSGGTERVVIGTL